METQEFYIEIIKHIDKDFYKKIFFDEKDILNEKYASEDFIKIKIKSFFANIMGLPVLDEYSSLMIDEAESIGLSFCLKILELYPVKDDSLKYWNEHVSLFSKAEKSGFSKDSVDELHKFLKNNFNFDDHSSQYIDHVSINNPGMNFLLIILHLDHLVSKRWKIKSISFNQVIKFRYVNKKPYYPSKSFSDFLLTMLLLNSKFSDSNGKYIVMPDAVPHVRDFEQWLDPLLEDVDVNKLKQLIKKMRTNERFCFLTEAYKFLGIPYGGFDTQIYEQVSQDNYNFLKEKLPEENWFDHINGVSGLWLIYFWQNFYFNFFKSQVRLNELACSNEILIIWKAFLSQYPSEGNLNWPSDLVQSCFPKE